MLFNKFIFRSHVSLDATNNSFSHFHDYIDKLWSYTQLNSACVVARDLFKNSMYLRWFDLVLWAEHHAGWSASVPVLSITVGYQGRSCSADHRPQRCSKTIHNWLFPLILLFVHNSLHQHKTGSIKPTSISYDECFFFLFFFCPSRVTKTFPFSFWPAKRKLVHKRIKPLSPVLWVKTLFLYTGLFCFSTSTFSEPPSQEILQKVLSSFLIFLILSMSVCLSLSLSLSLYLCGWNFDHQRGVLCMQVLSFNWCLWMYRSQKGTSMGVLLIPPSQSFFCIHNLARLRSPWVMFDPCLKTWWRKRGVKSIALGIDCWLAEYHFSCQISFGEWAIMRANTQFFDISTVFPW